jgi:hypothetical protein
MDLTEVMGSDKIPASVKVESAEQEIEGTDREGIIEAFRLGDSLYKKGTYDLYFGFVHGFGMQFLYHYPKGS